LSCDIARRRDGNFAVLGDRAQAPSGAGYALENRIVLSRVFPSLYRDSQVHRLALFFRSLRRSLAALSRQRDNREPLIVLLTPGPENETYFEHAFLAGYLGYTLAQSTDLTVRNRRLYLKTVEGHQQVDIVLRRVDDIFMDPLELKGDSLLGIPGILEVMRAGNVAVVNPPGVAVLENRALMAFFPQLCRYYLGEDLILPNCETLYLGEPKQLEQFWDCRERFVVKPVARGMEPRHLFPARWGEDEEIYYRQFLAEHAEDFVAQEILPGSSVPVLKDDCSIASARAIVRTYLVAAEGGYQVMPGGLARMAEDPNQLIITNQTGAASMDIWVLASEPQREISLLPTMPPSTIARRSRGGVPSRIADNIFWMARYAERAENTARLLRNAVSCLMHTEELVAPTQIAALLQLVTHTTAEYPGFAGDDSADLLQHPEIELARLVYDPQPSGGVRFNIQSLIRTAQNLRDNLSDDMRRIIALLENNPEFSHSLSQLHDHLLDTIVYLSAIAGLSQESMSRETGWHFLELGRRVERASFTLRLLRAAELTGGVSDSFLLENLLRINDIRITYRRRYRHRIDTGPVLDILLFDESNPRSVGFQLCRIRELTELLPATASGARPPAEKIALRLYTDYKVTELSELVAGMSSGVLGQWLQKLDETIIALTNSLTESYFTYLEEQSRIDEAISGENTGTNPLPGNGGYG
ncbi:MAG: circularly permuted type 2 ATP-grasp protein, partial [Leptospiraceae bacterium]|nr:circularly permuted type 2 ATP-grasp protein [Leptospiraceae bacterium]